MAFIQLQNFPDLTGYRYRADLDGETFIFNFKYNDRGGNWSVAIADVDGVPIRSGLAVRTAADLLAFEPKESRPPGQMVVIDATENDNEAGETDLGDTIFILYDDLT